MPEAVAEKPPSRRDSRSQPVLVDGSLFPSIAAASAHIGCTPGALKHALGKGGRYCGHEVARA